MTTRPTGSSWFWTTAFVVNVVDSTMRCRFLISSGLATASVAHQNGFENVFLIRQNFRFADNFSVIHQNRIGVRTSNVDSKDHKLPPVTGSIEDFKDENIAISFLN